MDYYKTTLQVLETLGLSSSTRPKTTPSLKTLCLSNSGPLAGAPPIERRRVYATTAALWPCRQLALAIIFCIESEKPLKECIEISVSNLLQSWTFSVSPAEAVLVLYETRFKSKHRGLKCGGALKIWWKKIQNQVDVCLDELTRLKQVNHFRDLFQRHEPAVVPRYARINTILTSDESVLSVLASEGYTLTDTTEFPLSNSSIALDPLIPHLLHFPPRTDLHNHSLVLNHHLILQDKASCMPPVALNPPADAYVLDMCAAPGNKTSQLIAMSNHVDACERDPRRAELLRERLQQHCPNRSWQVHQGNVTQHWNSDWMQNVTHVMLDPSCSGSGMRRDALVHVEDDNEVGQHVDILAKNQIELLCFAMKLPRAQKIVYSTCSHHVAENENVLFKAMQEMGDLFHLVSTLPSWPRRGLVQGGLNEEQANMCVRVHRDEDFMHGFFVATLERNPNASFKLPKLVQNRSDVQSTSEAVKEKPAPLRTAKKTKIIVSTARRNGKRRLAVPLTARIK